MPAFFWEAGMFAFGEGDLPSPQSSPRMGEEGRGGEEAPPGPAAVGSCFRRNDEKGER